MDNEAFQVLARVGQAIDAGVSDEAEWKWEDRFDAALVVLTAAQTSTLYSALSKASDDWTYENIGSSPDEVQTMVNDMGGLRAGQHLFSAWLDAFSFVYISSWPWNDQQHVSIRFGIHYPNGDFTDEATGKVLIMRGLGMAE